MKTLKWIDKTNWARGDWDDECDKYSWSDESTGLPCLIVRHPQHGSFCGYVGVDERHPMFGRTYDDESLENIAVHYGLTYSEFCQQGADEHGVCHIPEPGQTDHIFWFGFDCAHYGDYLPGHSTLLPKEFRINKDYETYKNVDYVMSEVKSLALQLNLLRIPAA